MGRRSKQRYLSLAEGPLLQAVMDHVKEGVDLDEGPLLVLSGTQTMEVLAHIALNPDVNLEGDTDVSDRYMKLCLELAKQVYGGSGVPRAPEALIPHANQVI